jgi:acyl carrier protein
VTEDQARKAILTALAEVAPEVDGASLDPAVPLQDQIDLDSMDFLSLVLRIDELTGIEIPERDYPLLSSLDAGTHYLSRAG